MMNKLFSAKIFRFHLITTIILMLLIVSGCGKSSKAQRQSPIAVELEEITEITIKKPQIVFGITEPNKESNLSFQASGVIDKIHAKEGAFLKKGELLATLDKESIELNVALQKSRYYEASVNYRKMKKGYRKEIVKQHHASYNQATASYIRAKSDYDASKILHPKGAITKGELDRTKSAFDAAKAAKNGAYQAYKMYIKGYETSDIKSAGVRTNQAATQVKIAKKLLKDTELRIPFDGVIAKKNVNIGELVSSPKIAFHIMDLSKIKIRLGIPERLIGQIEIGQKAYVNLKSIAPTDFSKLIIGRVDSRGLVLDKSTLTYPVDVIIPNKIIKKSTKGPLYQMLPGQIVGVIFVNQNRKKGMTIPISALLNDGSSKFLYVNRGGKAAKVIVKTGAIVRNRFVVLGLKPKDQVVVKGQHQLTQGRELFIIKVNKQNDFQRFLR
jgi:HlyD family secretion protein